MTAPAAQAPCPACGGVVLVHDVVCPSCGSPLAPPQRRVVTVLFVDLSGYTALCAQLDHEEVHLLVRPLMNGLRRVCEDLGGVVAGIEGDGFMAVFGGLQSDPDDPIKAVVAAAKLQRVVEERRRALPEVLPNLRAGVHLGEVLVAPSWEQSGFSVSGDVVNVTKRLCDVAEPGQVLVSQDLQDLLHLDVWGSSQSWALKNRSERVVAAELLWRDLTASLLARQRPVTTPLTGRAADLTRLSERAAEGPVLLVGEAGVGKSRLVSEWTLVHPRDVALRAHCASFDTAADLSVCQSLVRASGEAHVAGALALLSADDAARVQALRSGPAPAAESGTAAQYVHAVVALLAAISQTQSVSLVVEDAQWASTTVLALISGVLTAAPRLTVILTARTEADLLDLDCPRLRLDPLTGEEARELLLLLLPSAPDLVLETLGSRSGGLPLYLEQGAQLLLENGTVALTADGCQLLRPAGLTQVPTVMRLFVGARLDELPEAERVTLATASVLGDVVEPLLLDRLVADAAPQVEALVERGLLQWSAELSPSGRPLLRFSHAMVRDVAYESMLRRSRADIHCAAADWYAVLPVQEMLKARAKHLASAVELSPPDCDLAREAAAAMTQWAESILAERPPEALDVLDRLLALVALRPECDIPMLRGHLALAHVHELLGQEQVAATHGGEARRLAGLQEDRSLQAAAALVEARALVLGAPDRAVVLLREAEEHFQAADDRAGAARAAVERAILLEGTEGLAELLRAHEEAYRVGVLVADGRLASHAAQQLAFLCFTDSATRSRLWLERARSAVRQDDEVGRATITLAEAIVDVETLELAKAAQSTRRALEEGTVAGADFVVRNALILGAETAVQLCDPEADSWLDQLARAASGRPNALLDHNLRVDRALLAARQGAPDRADALLGEAWSAAQHEGTAYERTFWAWKAQVLCERGDFGEAAAAAQRAVRLDDELAQPLPALRIRLVDFRARVASRQRISLSEGLSLPREAVDRGAPAIRVLARLWLELDETLRGERMTLEVDSLPDLAEARALVHEITALRTGDSALLLDAAAEWATLGTTVWHARALLWHEELTGTPHPLSAQVLSSLGAPSDLAIRLRGQVAGLR